MAEVRRAAANGRDFGGLARANGGGAVKLRRTDSRETLLMPVAVNVGPAVRKHLLSSRILRLS